MLASSSRGIEELVVVLFTWARWEQGVIKAVLLDETFSHDIEELGPDFSDTKQMLVNTPDLKRCESLRVNLPELVEAFVGERVDGVVERVWVFADTANLVSLWDVMDERY